MNIEPPVQQGDELSGLHIADLPNILFLQKRSVRAGAQTSLARILASKPLEAFQSTAILGQDGWLGRHLKERGVRAVVVPFPSPRALTTRLLGFGGFCRAVTQRLGPDRGIPAAIIANDHQECPPALALAACLADKGQRIPVLAILRTPGMSHRDFIKYRCHSCDALLVVGSDLLEKVSLWWDKTPTLFVEGFSDDEYQPFPIIRPEFPDRLLIIGSEEPRKGFADFIEAIDRVEARHPDFPALQCDFTGNAPETTGASASPIRRAHFSFIGRVERFSELLQNYQLAVHPSRAETFGLAPLEAILGGVPTLVSATGVIPQLDPPHEWQFPPCDPCALAERMEQLWKHWPEPVDGMKAFQSKIRESYHIERTGRILVSELESLGLR